MDADIGIFKISETSFVCTDLLEKKLETRIFFRLV